MTDLHDGVDIFADCPVEVVRWPTEAGLREALARVGVPRLLLIDADGEPPRSLGVDEDWVRLPAKHGDLLARATRLSRQASHLYRDEPYIDRHRVLHRAGTSVPLTTTEAALLNLLLKHRGSVVLFDDLERDVWNGHAQSRDAIDAAVYRLRRRLSGLSLVIRSVRGRGFVIDADRAA